MPQASRETPTIVVIGAGAAGVMAAIFAARGAAERLRVVLLERTRDGGRKIMMSGGGRCNVLPSVLEPSRFVTASSPNTLKKLLLSWPLAEQRRFFEDDLAIPLALESETGKLFPVSNKARDVRDGLLGMAARVGAEVRLDAHVVGLEPPVRTSDGRVAERPEGPEHPRSAPWTVRLADGASLRASSVIVATGGLSVPATGSDGLGLELMRRLGHTIHETYPALTPLTAEPHHDAALAGISLDVTLEAPGPKRTLVTEGGFLFTHKGYSGPSVLNLSHLAVLSRRSGGPRQAIYARWTLLRASDWDRLLREEGGTVLGILRRRLPARLAEALLEDAGIRGSTATAQLRREERARLVESLTHHPLPWTGDEGYKRAEVTGGGVHCDAHLLTPIVRPVMR